MANTIHINSFHNEIESVTVYQSDRASIQRRFPIDGLVAGRNEIVIERLPSTLDPESIRVEAQTVGNLDAEIFDVIHTPATNPKRSPAKEKQLDALRKEKAELVDKKKVAEQQADVLLTYAKSLSGQDTSPDKLGEFLGFFANQNEQIHKRGADIENQLRDVDVRIRVAERASHEDEQSRKRGSAVKVIVVVPDGQSGAINMVLSYFIPGASWSSLFDLRVKVAGTTAATASLSLEYRASIQQNTGEDWTNVALTLSTASPLLGSAIPSLNPLHISRAPTGGSKSMAMFSSAASNMPMVESGSGSGSTFALAARRNLSSRKVAVRGMEAVEGVLHSTFVIPATSNIPSDDSSHKVAITTLNNLHADLEWICIPKEIPSAFLRCQVKNTSTFILLPGPCNVYLDGNFACKSHIPNVSSQETFTCSLGVDPSIRCTYHPQEKVTTTRSGGLMASKSTVTTFTQRITLKNTRPSAVHKLILRDQVYISEDARLKVTVIDPPERDLGPFSVSEPLVKSAAMSSSGAQSTAEPPKIATISPYVTARWAPKNEEDGGWGGPAGTGVVEWICQIGTDDPNARASIASTQTQSKTALTAPPTGSSSTLDVELKWEVSGPPGPAGKWTLQAW